MRIISGQYKGKYIPVRKNFNARPTTDFAKENLFNILNNNFDYEDLDVLDLFSGTGSISYEFASRGCRSVISVEKDFKSYSSIKQISIELGIDSIKTVRADAFKFIKKCPESFDVVFADPPYDLPNLKDIPEEVLKSTILKESGWLILEHGKNHQFNDSQYLVDVRTYGSVHFSIFQQK